MKRSKKNTGKFSSSVRSNSDEDSSQRSRSRSIKVNKALKNIFSAACEMGSLISKQNQYKIHIEKELK